MAQPARPAAGCWSSAAARPGMELAALSAEAGMDVELHEAEDELGGQLRYVVRAPRHEGYGRYLDWQRRRLATAGVST